MQQESFVRKMKAIHKALADGDDNIDTVEAIMVLAASLGYVLAHGLSDEADLAYAYSKLIADIDTARVSALAMEVASNAIDKAKH